MRKLETLVMVAFLLGVGGTMFAAWVVMRHGAASPAPECPIEQEHIAHLSERVAVDQRVIQSLLTARDAECGCGP